MFLDFDPVTDDVVARAAAKGITRDEIDDRRKFLLDACLAQTYVEHTDRGHHACLIVAESFVGRRAARILKTCFAIDVLTGTHYCNITGRRANDLPPVDATKDIALMFDAIEKAHPEFDGPGVTGPIGVDCLTDEEAWAVLELQRPATYLACGTAECHDFSLVVRNAIGDLAKITNRPRQVFDMLMRTPLLAPGLRCEQGHTERRDKFTKLFEVWWQEVLETNVQGVPLITRRDTGRLPSVAHGRAKELDLIAENARRHEKLLTSQAPDAPPAPPVSASNDDAPLDHPAADTPTFSPKVAAIVDRIKTTAPEIFVNGGLRLTLPPGISASFCAELGEMVTDPQPAYIYSGFLFNLSALLSRKFKDSTSLKSTTLQFVVTGKFYTGKSKAADACYRAFECAAAYADADPADPTRIIKGHVQWKLRGTVHKGTHASVNMLHKNVLERNGNLGPLTDEAGNQVDRMLSGQDHLATALRDYYKLSYDAGSWDGELTPPGSLTGDKSGNQFPCFNVNLPVYMTCTDAALKAMRISDLMDGYWTRPIVHYYSKPLDEEPLNDESTLRQAFSPRLANVIRDALMYGNALDLEYAPVHEEKQVKDPNAAGPDAKPMLEMVKRPLNMAERRAIADAHLVGVTYSPEAVDLRKRVQQACRSIVRAIQIENPNSTDWREIIVRLPDNARRVAVLLASIDHLAANPLIIGDAPPLRLRGVPQVNVTHLAWAFRYVLYWSATLLTGIDKGNVAIGMGSAELVVLDNIDRARRSRKMPISERDLRQACKYRLKQCMEHDEVKGSIDMLFESTLRGLDRDGLIKRVDHSPKGPGGYATPHVFAETEHPYWKGE